MTGSSSAPFIRAMLTWAMCRVFMGLLRREWSNVGAGDQRAQDMPVAPPLVLGAVAQKRHVLALREPLDQAQRELLAMILDGTAPLVDRAVEKKLGPVLLRERLPRDRAFLQRPKGPLARAEAGHPDVVARCGDASAAESGHENAQAVTAAIDGRANALRFQHESLAATRLGVRRIDGDNVQKDV